MSVRQGIVLVDTSVWLDNYIPERPGFASSRAFLKQARVAGLQLVYPVHILKDVFFLLQATYKQLARERGELSSSDAIAIRELAWACVENMRSLATAVGADESDAWTACRYRQLTGDLEDNFVIAAAQRANVDYLVKNDVQLIKNAPVVALAPEAALTLLESRSKEIAHHFSFNA